MRDWLRDISALGTLPIRIGHGFDLHRLEPGHDLIVGGVKIEHDCGCIAHSDGDVVYHAASDAILSALGQDDIGTLFPDSDPKWQGADSSRFVSEVARLMSEAGFHVGNLDVTVILQKPNLASHRLQVRKNLADLLRCNHAQVGIKGKTHENVDAIGAGRAIACHAIVLLAQCE